jgi:osmotically-inducible protein OsmY
MKAHRSRNAIFRPLLPAALALAATVLGGCVAATVGAATVTTVDVAYDRRTVGTYVDDNVVEIKIRRDIRVDGDLHGNANVSVTSMNGIVLLTGQVPEARLAERAVGYARSYPEVRQVINQLDIAEKSSFASRMQDTWLTTKVKSALLASRDIESSRYKVVTEDGTVYLLGLVTQEEAQIAIDIARTVRGVQRIVKAFEYI